MKKLFFVELFAGIGGMSQGFETHGGFEAIALTDIDLDSRDTYCENFQDKVYLTKDAQFLATKQLRNIADGKDICGILGCPPCQGFSPAGKRDSQDERNRRIKDFLRITKELRPRFFVFENVPRVIYSNIFQELIIELDEAGYSIWSGVLNAALYGLPQTRQRAIAIGIDKTLSVSPTPPPITHVGCREVFDYANQRFVMPCSYDGFSIFGFYPDTLRIATGDVERLLQKNEMELSVLSPIVTVGDALDDLPEPAWSQNEEPILYKSDCDAVTEYQYKMRCGSDSVHSHSRRKHNLKSIGEWSKVPVGGKPGFDTKDQRYFSQAYGRLHPRGLSRTITCGFMNPGCGRFLHYKQSRSITIREAARLQSLKDNFRFIKSQTINCRLVGNAFPPLWAEAIAAELYRILSDVL
ncbi:MAG: DNA cytosine methyltransferase [Proteobacteria bacterium]|nr:DNA cytosine methyltransferase [Pseudomonadota bacterium]